MKKITVEKKSLLDEEIELLHIAMRQENVTREEYSNHLSSLERLYSIKEEVNKKNRVSKDTMWMIFGNLAGIALILSYEKASVITSKAIGFVIKGRV